MKKSAIGVISDTHGLLRPETFKALRNSDLIIHAGDVGKPEIIEALKSIAPVVAIRGNNDKDKWARRFPETAVVKVGKIRIYIIHDLKELEIDPAAAGFRVVISGHSHRPSVVERVGVLFLNPGSAGPHRFKLPVAVARLRVRDESVSSHIVELPV
ncbi:MAG: metallophosphoesterase family protein [Deltaproteobacteria bacterium]|nr:metallophosphoesterase family protein [Deltaproteobacteria bacterium]